MQKIRSLAMALWKTGYPLMAYYLSVFSAEVIFRTMGWEIKSSIQTIFPGALLTLAILWFPYKKDWIYRQGIIKKPGPSPVPHWEYLIILGIAASIAGNLVLGMTPLTQWFPGVEEAAEQIDASGFFLQLAGICLVIPAAEEMVFRGIGYGGLRDEMGAVPACIVSSLFFGVFHGNLVQGIYAGFLGMILAFVMERYRSLTAVWLVHAAMNAGSLYVLQGILADMMNANLAVRALAALISLAVTAAVLRFIGRKMPAKPWKFME